MRRGQYLGLATAGTGVSAPEPWTAAGTRISTSGSPCCGEHLSPSLTIYLLKVGQPGAITRARVLSPLKKKKRDKLDKSWSGEGSSGLKGETQADTQELLLLRTVIYSPLSPHPCIQPGSHVTFPASSRAHRTALPSPAHEKSSVDGQMFTALRLLFQKGPPGSGEKHGCQKLIHLLRIVFPP